MNSQKWGPSRRVYNGLASQWNSLKGATVQPVYGRHWPLAFQTRWSAMLSLPWTRKRMERGGHPKGTFQCTISQKGQDRERSDDRGWMSMRTGWPHDEKHNPPDFVHKIRFFVSDGWQFTFRYGIIHTSHSPRRKFHQRSLWTGARAPRSEIPYTSYTITQPSDFSNPLHWTLVTAWARLH